MDHMADLVGRLHRVKNLIHGCESLSVSSSDGLILATTCTDRRQGDGLAAVGSFLLASCSKGLAPYRAGECRALDFRGDRQILLVRLEVAAFIVAVLHPGAAAVNVDEPSLRAAVSAVPSLLHAQDPDRSHRWLLQRDRTFRYPIRHGRFLVGRAAHCDVVLASARVNAEHLLIENIGGQLQATDLDTEHGTKVNGKSIAGPVPLEAGDRISLPRASGFVVVALDPEGRELGAETGEERAAPAAAPAAAKKKTKR